MQSDHQGGDGKHLRTAELINTSGDGWNDRKDHTKIRQQAKKPADQAEKVKIRQFQKAEHSHADAGHKQTAYEVSDKEGAHHFRNAAQCGFGFWSIARVEEAHSCISRLVPPAQHEV